MSNSVEVKSTGISALGLLGVIFVVCKIFSVGPIADWSWWWVTAPFWGGIALVLVVLGVFLMFALLVAVIAACVDR